MEKKFDEAQKKAIDAIKNSVVSAGAGSGKTTVLAQRFLKLTKPVSEGGKGFHVDEILTLTFTKKATVEMSSRIYAELKKNNPEEAKNFYKANIKTLDSYCNSVAKMGCHFYGISPDFTQDNEKIKEYAKQIALPLILSNKDNLAIKALVKTKEYENMANEMFIKPVLYNSTIITPLDFDKMLKDQQKKIIQVWNEGIEKSESIILAIKKIASDYMRESYDKKNICQTAKTILSQIELLPSEMELDLTEISNNFFELDAESQSEIFEKMKESKETIVNASKVKKPGKTGGFYNLSELIENLKEINTKKLDGAISFIKNFDVIKNAFSLINQFQTDVNNFKRTNGFLTFSDISQLALSILKEHPEIRQTEKEKYKAIMIDEFQDNNSLQRDMLFMLAEKKERNEKGIPSVEELESEKLFFVGDEKQSIYLFRGADVSVFRGLSKDFSEGNLNMSTNYRSEPALIAAFNSIFGGIPYPPNDSDSVSEISDNFLPAAFFTEEDEKNELVPDYEAVYHKVDIPKSKLENASKIDLEKIYAPHVHFATYNANLEADDEKLCYTEAEAEWIAQKIEKIVENGVDDVTSEDGHRNISYNDIAILLKTTTELPTYERALLKHGIPYNTECLKQVFDEGLVNDIYSILRICVYPNDKNAYATVLRGPLVNLSIPSIKKILTFFGKYKSSLPLKEPNLTEQNDTLMPFSEEYDGLLEGDELAQFQNARIMYRNLLEETRKSSITKLINKIWYDFGYRYETLWKSNLEIFSKMYDVLFELARQADEKNIPLASFSDSLKNLKPPKFQTFGSDDSKKIDDLNILSEQLDGVKIMTIHKSKGLEFPVVFIANTEKAKSEMESRGKVQFSKEFGVTFSKASKILYNLAKEENDKKDGAELRRVTYVAITRAINEVYITNGKYKSKNENEKATDSLDFLPGVGKIPLSIFEVLMPSFEKKSSYFTHEEIPQYDRESEKNENQSEITQKILHENDKNLSEADVKNAILSNEKVKNAQEIQTEKIKPRYIAASHLETENSEFMTKSPRSADEVENEIAGEVERESASEIDEIINKTIPKGKTQPLFTAADFGTIAHAYMEAAIKNEKPKISQKNIAEIPSEKLKRVFEICSEMAATFCESEIGQKAIKSEWKKSEYEFTWRINNAKSQNDEKIMNGSIDLVFQDGSSSSENAFTIVDFKTDKIIESEKHIKQLSCYREALSQMLGCNKENIKCVLYYLRYGKTVDITDKTKTVDWL